MKWSQNRWVAAAASVAVGLSLVAGTHILAAPGDPAFYLEGMRLQNVVDGQGVASVQAFVDLYVSDSPYFNAGSMNLYFNKEYWIPSDFTTNVAYQGEVAGANFFQADKTLYGDPDVNPFYDYRSGGTGTPKMYTWVSVDSDRLSLGLTLRSVRDGAGAITGDDYPNDQIYSTKDRYGNDVHNYIDATSKVKLGTLSFRIDPDKIPEVMKNLPCSYNNPYSEQLDFTTPGSSATIAENCLLSFTDDGVNGQPTEDCWTISSATVRNGVDTGDLDKVSYRDSVANMEYTFQEVLIDAEPAVKNVEINAYQAYHSGDPRDIAAALQRYSPTIRTSYPNGDKVDTAIYWGSTTMRVTDLDSGCHYEFVYSGGSWSYQEIDGTTGAVIAPNAAGDYNCKQGQYLVQQTYYYRENGQTLAYTKPMEVYLTVTPVTVTGVTADNGYKSYLSNEAALPADCDGLELPAQGRIVFDTVLGDATPTIPLATWINTTSGQTLPVTDMSVLETTPSGTFWPVNATDIAGNTGVGLYEFACADPTQATIQGAYPWATVNNSYTVGARREILPNTATKQTYTLSASVDGPTGRQNINVDRTDGTQMNAGSTFRVYLPDGTEVDPNWFGSATSSSHTATVNGTGWRITTSPGNNTGANRSERDYIRRHINLGGYFSVQIYEPNYGYSDILSVYSPRRQNAYTQTRSYDFTGNYAGIYPFHRYDNLATTVVLPYGNDPRDGSAYHIQTRYDGISGAEPGYVNSFSASTNWNGVGDQSTTGPVAPPSTLWQPGEEVTYGISPYAAMAYTNGFGPVENPSGHTVEMKVEAEDVVTPPIENVVLTTSYYDPAHFHYYYDTTSPANQRIRQTDKVTFDTKKEGYPYRQEFVLTLTNRGTTDLHGLHIDPISGIGVDPDPTADQHFEILQQPASELPAGASTTFVVSYDLALIYDTAHGGIYKDTIYINSTNGTVKSFVAQFRVVPADPYKLTIQPLPETGGMGNGSTVMGISNTNVYDPAPAGNYFILGDEVWLLVEPTDEYQIKKDATDKYMVYYIDSTSGNNVYLTSRTHASLKTGEFLFQLPGGMPDRDLTIYIQFFEPITSKLRLDDLIPYADQFMDAPGTLCVSAYEKPLYWDSDRTKVGYDPEEEAYLVVIPYEADFSGLSLTLRDLRENNEIVGPPATANDDIAPTVHIELDDLGHTVILDEAGTTGPDPTPPSTHKTAFRSPDPGQQRTATITLSYQEGTTLYTREYKVTFIRQTLEAIHTFAYGNTPYGMIMNASNIAPVDKAAAKAAYDVNNRYDAAYLPTKAAAMADYTYWPEAWRGDDLDKDDYALAVYAGGDFVEPGIKEVLDSTGTPVSGLVKREVTVDLLDSTGAKLLDRYNGTITDVIDLGDVTVTDGAVGPTTVTALVSRLDIRPGIYAIQYSFTDFDGSTRHFTRPLAILDPLGDVDASGTADSVDADLIQLRAGSELLDGRGNAMEFQEGLLPFDAAAVNYSAADRDLYRYRICDVNDDRNINNIDANRILEGGALVEFYEPVDYIG